MAALTGEQDVADDLKEFVVPATATGGPGTPGGGPPGVASSVAKRALGVGLLFFLMGLYLLLTCLLLFFFAARCAHCQLACVATGAQSR